VRVVASGNLGGEGGRSGLNDCIVADTKIAAQYHLAFAYGVQRELSGEWFNSIANLERGVEAALYLGESEADFRPRCRDALHVSSHEWRMEEDYMATMARLAKLDFHSHGADAHDLAVAAQHHPCKDMHLLRQKSVNVVSILQMCIRVKSRRPTPSSRNAISGAAHPSPIRHHRGMILWILVCERTLHVTLPHIIRRLCGS
jgi:hypothetical protein